MNTPPIRARHLPLLTLLMVSPGAAIFAAPTTLSESDLEQVLTLREAAGFLRVPPPVLERMARTRQLPARRLAGEWRFSRIALLRWLNLDQALRLEVVAAPAAPAASTVAPAGPEVATRAPPASVAERAAAPAPLVPASRGAAAPATPIGEAPATATAEQVALRDQAILMPAGRGSIEAAMTYGRLERQPLPNIRQESATTTTSLGLRYGIANDLQFSATLPYRHTRSTVFSAIPGVPDARNDAGTMGDPTLAVLGLASREGPGRPTLIWNLQAIAPGGIGDAALGGGLAFAKSSDPVILFGGLSYLRGLRVDASAEQRSLARHNYAFHIGYALSLNDKVALSGQFIGSYRNHAPASGAIPAPRERYQLQFGIAYLVSPKLVIEPTIAIGIGGSAPDLNLGLSLPYAF